MSISKGHPMRWSLWLLLGLVGGWLAIGAPALLPRPSVAAGQELAVETRFWTGCNPGPYSSPPVAFAGSAPQDVAAAPLEAVALQVDLSSAARSRPLLGNGFNLEHGLWSCPEFQPLLGAELLEPFRPAVIRFDTGMLPAAPDYLTAQDLGPDVYRSVLASAPYAHSWDLLRSFNRSGTRLILGVWGGPGQFTDDGTRWGTLMPQYYENYVDYVATMVDFIVREQQVEVWAITIANEPDGGDGNQIPPDGLGVIAHRLAVRLAPYGVKLYGPDTASAENAMKYLPLLLDDPVVADALAFVGFHQYYPAGELDSAVSYVRARRPDLPVIVTEYTSFTFGDLDSGEEASDELGFTLDIAVTALAHYRGGVDAAVYWDAVDYLQPGRDAITRWGLLRSPTEGFARRAWYYSFLQVLPYLGPGARVLSSQQHGGDEVTTLAVRTAQDGLAVFAVNQGAGEHELSLELLEGDEASLSPFAVRRTDESHRADWVGELSLQDGQGTLTLPGRSVTTLFRPGPQPPSAEEPAGSNPY